MLIVSKWWDIDFSRHYYPYVPAHVTKPNEQLSVYSASLPEKCIFAVPKNLQLVAVPLFELYGNVIGYGHVISSVPSQLSRFHINLN
jgi:cleavage and polyadenylation specificity factor subunit 5